jgi:flagellar basal-body rod protein FlgB
MIEALFNQPGYLAAKKTLDAVALRQEAVANNIVNLETPGYKRVDLAPAFQTELERACASGDARQIASLNPTLAPDPNAVASSLDGNSVHLENELMQLNQNSTTHALETELVSNMLSRMRLAITGKS